MAALLHGRLDRAPGWRVRLDADGACSGANGCDAVLRAEVGAGETICWSVVLARGGTLRGDTPLAPPGGGAETVFDLRERFSFRELFARVDGLAAAAARALGSELPPLDPRPAPTRYLALRDYLRAADLMDGADAPLEAPDRRRKLELLLLAVEAEPLWRPAGDALIEAALRAHEKGLRREARRSLDLLARLAPLDPRARYVLDELDRLDGPRERTAP